MANAGYISEAHIRQWDKMLSENPLIDNDMERLKGYIKHIHNNLTREQKGADLGVSIFIADAIQGASVGLGETAEANRISAEVNNRMFAHLLYNKEIHQLDFIDSNVAQNPTPKLIEMSQTVMASPKVKSNTAFTEIGIKGIQYIASEILD